MIQTESRLTVADMGCKAESFLSYIERHTLKLDQYTSGSNGRNETFGITFTFTHTHFGRLLSDGLVGEYADPYLTLTLHVAGHGDTCGRCEGLDLPR